MLLSTSLMGLEGGTCRKEGESRGVGCGSNRWQVKEIRQVTVAYEGDYSSGALRSPCATLKLCVSNEE